MLPRPLLMLSRPPLAPFELPLALPPPSWADAVETSEGSDENGRCRTMHYLFCFHAPNFGAASAETILKGNSVVTSSTLVRAASDVERLVR